MLQLPRRLFCTNLKAELLKDDESNKRARHAVPLHKMGENR